MLADQLAIAASGELRTWVLDHPSQLQRVVEQVQAAWPAPGTVMRFMGDPRRWVVVAQPTAGRVHLVALHGSYTGGEATNAHLSRCVRDTDQRVAFSGLHAKRLAEKALVVFPGLIDRLLQAPAAPTPVLPGRERAPAVESVTPERLRAAAIMRDAKVQRSLQPRDRDDQWAIKARKDDAIRYKREQVALEAVARAVEAGENLPKLRTVRDVERLVHPISSWLREMVDKHGPVTLADFNDGEALLGRTVRAMRAAEAQASVGDLKGYHPTPPALAQKAVQLARIEPGMKVLEPSAGSGQLAETAREAGAEVYVIEIDPRLQAVLDARGFPRVGSDFMLYNEGGWERILMNPPFERGQEIDHVLHAFDLLAPGGRLVAIMSEGPFFRSDRKATAFRAWLESARGQSEKNPQNSFRGSMRSTDVATRTVVVDKPMERRDKS